MSAQTIICCLLILLSVGARAQQATVTGKVLSQNRILLVSAYVGIEGTNTGTQTNEQGAFKLSVPAEADIRLIIKYINYRDQQVSLRLNAGETREITVVLTNDTSALNTV